MKELESQFEKAKQIKLTQTEKDFMRANLVMLMSKNPVTSPYYLPSSWMKPVLSVMSALVLVIIGGAGVSISAAKALPGDFLYGIKVHVNEEVAGVLISSPEQKLIWQGERVQKRIVEIQTLAKEGELTKAKTEVAVKALDTHIDDLNKSAAELAPTNPGIVQAVAATIDKDTEKVNTEVEAGAKLSMEKEKSKESEKESTDNKTEIESAKDEPSTLRSTEASKTEEVKLEKSSVEENKEENTKEESKKSKDEAENIKELETQVSILKTKIAKEKIHLESLTEAIKNTVKSDEPVSTTLTPLTQ
jgi:flagellar biosynthesis GTPase FlhF